MINTINLQYILLGALGAIFAFSFSFGFNDYLDRRDIMLCKSAKVSGNSEYLAKCGCYYVGGNISCIYEGGATN